VRWKTVPSVSGILTNSGFPEFYRKQDTGHAGAYNDYCRISAFGQH
jgi:hypothetical protein